MQRVLFFPLGILGGLLATMIGRRAARRLWAAVDDEALPSPDHRDVSSPKLVAALAIEGAIFGVARGVTDRGLRRAVQWATGEWPGSHRSTSHDERLDQAELPDTSSTPG
jgi:hypothetical protein